MDNCVDARLAIDKVVSIKEEQADEYVIVEAAPVKKKLSKLLLLRGGKGA